MKADRRDIISEEYTRTEVYGECSMSPNSKSHRIIEYLSSWKLSSDLGISAAIDDNAVAARRDGGRAPNPPQLSTTPFHHLFVPFLFPPHASSTLMGLAASIF